MKILLVGLDKLGRQYGGGQVYVQSLVDGFLANKHDVAYMSIAFSVATAPKKVLSDYKTIKELQVILPQSWQLNDRYSEKSDIVEAISEVFKEINPDIIHAHGWKEYASLAAFRCKIPCVVTAHHGGIVCPAGALLNHNDEICTIAASYKNCLPCCVQNIPGGRLWLPFLRLLPINFQLRVGKWLKKMRFVYFITPLGIMALTIQNKLDAVQTLGRYATRLIAPSNAIRDAMVRNGIPNEKVVVVPHGIPLPERKPLRANFGKTPTRLLYVGRISYVKGLHVMLEAFKGIASDQYELHIVGGAVTKLEQRYLKKLKKEYGDVKAIWHGGVAHEEIMRHIAACDVMIHPAICLEVFGLNIAEALAVGRPVIATRCGGSEMQIRDGENGWLVPPNDVLALRKTLYSVMNKPSLVKEFANKKSAVISIEQHLEDLKKVYKSA
ncbi:MAG TPA: glycosyltransferase [Smithellaceae bacterium]|nr:glycosyltransferase [Smithellaceae bacterium]